MDTDLPLEGIRVIDLGQIYAAPYCTLQLAYFGAEVVKIEPPGKGEFLRVPDLSPGGVNYAFLMLNANKKSVTLNLKHPRGCELLMRILEDADVLVENYVAGAMESLGLGYDKLGPRFPRLIYASGKGYGAESRWSRMGAMDVTVQASAGVMSVTGFADRPGVKTPTTFIDMGTGMHLVAGILAALLQRGRTGRGQKVEVAMHDVAIPALTSQLGPVLEGHHIHRLGNRHRGACPCNVYPAADGDVLIFCLTDEHWQTLTGLMGREDLRNDPRFRNHATRVKIAGEVDALMEKWTRPQPRDAIIELLIEQGVPCSPVRTIEEVAADPEVTRRGMLKASSFPTRGAIRVLGSPIRLSAIDGDGLPVVRPPALGEHTGEVLARIGIDDTELEDLRRDGVI
jgi:crotonobetainyl-CoA:carnitine CoA-transferase CaiB-like acyl-CoA transferase